MQLFNKTQNNLISSDVLVSATLLQRMKGLLGRDGLDERQCMLIRPCCSVHTFFMKFPIDVIFVDKGLKVVKIIEDMGRGRTSPIVRRAWSVLEMPSGRAGKMGITEGDILEFSDGEEALDVK